MKSWTIKTLLKVTTEYLKKKQFESPRLISEILLAHQLKMNRVDLYLRFEQPLTPEEVSGYRLLVRRRLSREPFQYIVGKQEFWSLDFLVNAKVLIPRPESELLVEGVIKLVKSSPALQNGEIRILDLGTGCGALAVAMAKEIPNAAVWASDISSEALEVAGRNAVNHGTFERIRWHQGDLFAPFINQDLFFDFIVSNPPYVASEEYDDLPPEVRDHEPRTALDGLQGGLYFIEKIIKHAPDYLKPEGWVLIEMSPAQTETALNFIDRMPEYAEKVRLKDYAHRYRVVMAQRK